MITSWNERGTLRRRARLRGFRSRRVPRARRLIHRPLAPWCRRRRLGRQVESGRADSREQVEAAEVLPAAVQRAGVARAGAIPDGPRRLRQQVRTPRLLPDVLTEALNKD